MLEQAVNKNDPPLFRPPDSRILGSRNKQMKKNPVIKGLYKKVTTNQVENKERNKTQETIEKVKKEAKKKKE